MIPLVKSIGSERPGLSGDLARTEAEDARPGLSVEPSQEQLRYARVLDVGMRLGMVCLLVSFPLYILNVVKPHVPIEKTLACWCLRANGTDGEEGYNEKVGVKPGWSWVKELPSSDFLNLVGVCVLGSVTVACYLALIPLLVRREDWIYVVLAVLQVMILVLAASGVCSSGH
jgi:hypothetical protein